MANITLVDTGYANVESTGTIETDIAVSGTPLEINGVSFSYNRTANTDKNAEPGNYTSTSINYTSVNSPAITIRGTIKRGSLDGTNTELGDVAYLDEFVTTRGIKCVYYNDAEEDTDGYPLITKFIGVTDAYTNHPVEKHIHVRFHSFTITQSATGNSYTWQIQGDITR